MSPMFNHPKLKKLNVHHHGGIGLLVPASQLQMAVTVEDRDGCDVNTQMVEKGPVQTYRWHLDTTL